MTLGRKVLSLEFNYLHEGGLTGDNKYDARTVLFG